LEPLTVFIGPNGSGKSNICEAAALSTTRKGVQGNGTEHGSTVIRLDRAALGNDNTKFWRGITHTKPIELTRIGQCKLVKAYNFVPQAIVQSSQKEIQTSGEGIANSLALILFDNRDLFIELEDRFTNLVSNVSRIALDQSFLNSNRLNTLQLVDRYSDYHIPASEISDGTLRLLAFFVALYDTDSPDIICFEEPENGVHPWLLNKIMELLNQVSQEGIRGKPVQILVTTHSPVLLNYVEPEQIRAVELDEEGKTQVKALPTDSVRFQKALEAYDNELGELWFTNIFGGNPE